LPIIRFSESHSRDGISYTVTYPRIQIFPEIAIHGARGIFNRNTDSVSKVRDQARTYNSKLTTHSLLKRRQIRHSRLCAIATARLLRKVVASIRGSDPQKFIQRVQDVGKRLIAAQPRELVVGNIVRRVLGLIRDEEEEKRGESDFGISSESSDGRPQTPRIDQGSAFASIWPDSVSMQRHVTQNPSPSRPPLISSHTGAAGAAPVTSMFSILNHPTMTASGTNSPLRSGTATPNAQGPSDLRAELIEGISEIIDELDQSDEQIANYAPEHVHPDEVILTYSSSLTVQRFLLKAASKRKFTVIHAEAYPNSYRRTHALITGNLDKDEDDLPPDSFQKPLTSAGITVILIPDSAIFAVMSQVNKVIIGTHAILANGALVAAAGAKIVAKAAKAHQTPVIVLAGTYKLSPKYPYDPDMFVEFGDSSRVFSKRDEDLIEKVKVDNPIVDFVPPDMVDLYITNLGGHAPSYLYRIIKDQYREEDADL
jgi:translation initiation factor eIF-2B subunit beta